MRCSSSGRQRAGSRQGACRCCRQPPGECYMRGPKACPTPATHPLGPTHPQTAWAALRPRWGRSGCPGAAGPGPWLWGEGAGRQLLEWAASTVGIDRQAPSSGSAASAGPLLINQPPAISPAAVIIAKEPSGEMPAPACGGPRSAARFALRSRRRWPQAAAGEQAIEGGEQPSNQRTAASKTGSSPSPATTTSFTTAPASRRSAGRSR